MLGTQFLNPGHDYGVDIPHILVTSASFSSLPRFFVLGVCGGERLLAGLPLPSILLQYKVTKIRSILLYYIILYMVQV